MILTRSRQEATRWCTGSVPNAPKANLTCFWPLHAAALASIVVAHIAPANRLASATHCSRCTLRWLQSTILPRMVLGLSRFWRGPVKRPSGRMQVGTAGNKVLFSVLAQARKASKEHLSGLGLSSRRAPTCFEGALLISQLPYGHDEPMHATAVFVSRRLGTNASPLTCNFSCVSKLFSVYICTLCSLFCSLWIKLVFSPDTIIAHKMCTHLLSCMLTSSDLGVQNEV